jgi:hypothetical protein
LTKPILLCFSILLVIGCGNGARDQSTSPARLSDDALSARRTELLAKSEDLIEVDHETPSRELTPLQIGHARRLKQPLPTLEQLKATFGPPDVQATKVTGNGTDTRNEIEWHDPVSKGAFLSMELDHDGRLSNLLVYRGPGEWEMISDSGKWWMGFPVNDYTALSHAPNKTRK